MAVQPADAVMVIIEASSGIGRATPHAFADQRANLVLGARAIAVPTTGPRLASALLQ
jgi:NADP-dependent 3-hydroxy acid dehydrogenase YdfG